MLNKNSTPQLQDQQICEIELTAFREEFQAHYSKVIAMFFAQSDE